MIICLNQLHNRVCKAVNRDNTRYCGKCGHSLQHALHLLNPGEQIGQYRIRQIVGHGGFGAVYEAESLTNRRSVALKETFDPASIQSFRKEFTILRKIRHPNLPFYQDLFEIDGNGYLVMEYVPGQSLEEVLLRRQGPLLEKQVLGYAIQLCDVLSFLHGQTPWILHRDIKPANIRIMPDGVIKLVDFGLIKQGNSTLSSQIRLTPAYAPIEQYALASTDPRTDIYSLGATLYHLLTGKEPLPATQRVTVTDDPLEPPYVLNSQLSRTTSDAIVKAMARFQDERYASAAEFNQALIHGPFIPSSSVTPTLRICAKCGFSQDPDEIYCQHCRALLSAEIPCHACRKPRPSNAKFCPHCGK